MEKKIIRVGMVGTGTVSYTHLCPIVLDDALVNLDSGRREAAMELLGEIAKERQVILFTCS